MKAFEQTRGARNLLNPFTWSWWVLLLLSILLALGTWTIQATLDVERASDYARATLTFGDSQGGLLLVIEHPRELRVGTVGEKPRRMSLWLSRDGNPTPTSTSATPARWPTTVPTPTLTPTGSPTTVSTPIATPYVVAFTASQPGVMFVNSTGEPTQAEAFLRPTLPAAAALYLERLAPPGLLGSDFRSVTFTLQLYGPDGRALTASSTTSPLEMRLESGLAAVWRRLLELVFGPATTLLALAGAVAAYGLGRWEKQRKEWESEIRDIENRLDELRSLTPEDSITAYRRYDELCRRIEKHPEMAPRFNERWVSVCREDMQRALLRLAAKRIRDKDLAGARGMVAAARAAGSKLEAVEWMDRAIRLEWSMQSGSVLPESVAAPAAQAELYLRLYHAFDPLRELANERLLALAERDDGFVAVFNLRNNPLGLALLNQAKFQDLLDVKIGKAPSGSAEKTRLEGIKADLERQPRPLSPWAKMPPPIAQNMQSWLEGHGLKIDPFRAPFAEQEPDLERMLYEHPRLGQVVCSGSNVLVGPAGAGKTVARLYFEQHCYQANPPVWFPVRYELPATDNGTAICRTVAAAFGRALIPFIAHNPHGLTSLARQARADSVALLLAGAGDLRGLEEGLRLMAPEELSEISRGLLVELVRDAASLSVSTTRLSEETLLTLVELVARNLGFQHLYLLVDGLEGAMSSDQTQVRARLSMLLDSAPHWADHGIHLKLFLPVEAQYRLPALSDLGIYPLNWEDEQLLELLKLRLRVASDDKFDSLAAMTDATVDKPDEKLVEAAKRSPRQLIRLGHRLFSIHVQKRAELDKLTAQDYDDALSNT